MRVKCNVPNALDPRLIKHWLFARSLSHTHTHPSCQSAANIATPALYRVLLSNVNSEHWTRSIFPIRSSSGLRLLFFFRATFPSDRHFTTIIIFSAEAPLLLLCTVWNNERVWKCLIKSNKSPCDLFVHFFFGLKNVQRQRGFKAVFISTEVCAMHINMVSRDGCCIVCVYRHSSLSIVIVSILSSAIKSSNLLSVESSFMLNYSYSVAPGWLGWRWRRWRRWRRKNRT